jgi:cell division protein FtsB
MRVTTQMLNESSIKAGLPVNQTSLLNYINKDSSTTENSLLSALSKKSTTDATQKSSYEQLEESADALENAASVLTSEKEDNIFAQARENEDTEAVKKQTKELLSDYNDMLKKLGKSDSTLNIYYKQMLGEVYSNDKESLNSIGISADKDGYLSLDESKFDEADIDTLEKVLGKDSAFSSKAGFLAGHVASNAESYLENLSSQYSSTGTNYSSYSNNKYDFWG